MQHLTFDFGLDPIIAQELEAMGPKLDGELIERSRALFKPLQDHSLPEGGSRYDDLAYGNHSRQTIDVCTPGGEGHPILLFVPGGGFIGGDKAFYRHIPAFFAREGFVAAILNYRLAPEFIWPTGGVDAGKALDWLIENAARFGGDPEQVFIIGQSAGGCHAGTMLFHPQAQPSSLCSVRAAVLMSGPQSIVENTTILNAEIYFGSDPSRYADMSNVTHVENSSVPVYVTLAEYDPEYLVPSATALVDALTKRDGKAPSFTWLRGHNHLSPVLGMGSAIDKLGPAIAQTFRGYLKQPY